MFEEEQVDYMLRSLEWLEVLNGLKVERDALFNQESGSEEDDSRNTSPNKADYTSPARKSRGDKGRESPKRLMQIEPVDARMLGKADDLLDGLHGDELDVKKRSACFGNGERSTEHNTERHPYQLKGRSGEGSQSGKELGSRASPR